VNFDFSDDQKQLRDQARRFLADRCSPAAVRAVLEGEQSYDAELWKGLAEMGFLGAAIPEAYGGVGLGHLELCVIAEELGRALVPVPMASSIYQAAEALMLAGSEDQKQAWLPKLASGEAIGTLALAEGVGRATEKSIKATVSGGKLNGVKSPVADGDIADLAIVAAREGGKVSLYLVDLNGAGVTRETLDSIDPTRGQAALTFKDAPAAA
jgi:acyl-CoA dehydrogenase